MTLAADDNTQLLNKNRTNLLYHLPLYCILYHYYYNNNNNNYYYYYYKCQIKLHTMTKRELTGSITV